MPCSSSISISGFSSQTPLYLSDNTPRNIQLKNELKVPKEKIKNQKEKIEQLRKLLIESESVDHLLKISKLHLQPTLFPIVKTYCKKRYNYNVNINQNIDVSNTVHRSFVRFRFRRFGKTFVL